MRKNDEAPASHEIEIEDTNAPCRIFLIRHGETDWNKNFRYQGVSDVELNDAGLEQARRVALRLARTAPTRVYSSPLARARRTAEVIMEHNAGGAPIELCGDIREVSFGSWEGITLPEVKRLYPEILAAWSATPFSATPPGGEAFEDVASRARRAAALIKGARKPGEAVFVVAHGAVLRALIAAMLDIGNMDVMWRMRIDNCSVSVIDAWELRSSLLLLNDTHHARMDDGEIARLSFPS
ncbi:MAG: histidine phosphatase family protein [Synergistaceae bacterium]|jgi:alpha-ribazole phosphatase/probable phosphoglycerate mutase|nr:histidine phosphatase family protein [Synergistaceae bacterium]